MIVVATNNGADFLPNLLDSMEKYGTGSHMVAVVDTGSTDKKFAKYVQTTGEKYDFVFPHMVHGGRDTGAYLAMAKKYNTDTYMFMHDSMLAKDDKWIHRFEDKLDNGIGIVAHSLFPMETDEWPPCGAIKEKLPFNPDEMTWDYGVFGPIFFTGRAFIDRVIATGCDRMIPFGRDEAHGTERLWGAIAKRLGFGVTSVYGLYDHDKIQQDAYDGLQKFLPIRP